MSLIKLIAYSAPVFLLSFIAAPAVGAAHFDYSVFVGNSNLAEVHNHASTKAYTGDNQADGGHGGEAGDGGNVECSADDNYGGHGGNAGDGGEGGQILTGDAHAMTTINNEINMIRTVVERDCECPEPDINICCENKYDPRHKKYDSRHKKHDYGHDVLLNRSVRIINDNLGIASNQAETKADTGGNDADGGNGGDAGNGGGIYDSKDDNFGGNAGHGGTGGLGGLISTGLATSDTHIMNLMNRVVTRVRF